MIELKWKTPNIFSFRWGSGKQKYKYKCNKSINRFWHMNIIFMTLHENFSMTDAKLSCPKVHVETNFRFSSCKFYYMWMLAYSKINFRNANFETFFNMSRQYFYISCSSQLFYRERKQIINQYTHPYIILIQYSAFINSNQKKHGRVRKLKIILAWEKVYQIVILSVAISTNFCFQFILRASLMKVWVTHLLFSRAFTI